MVLCDIPILDGHNKDGTIKVSSDGPQYVDITSADGVVTRYRTLNRVRTVELTLDQSSEEHAKLSALHALDTNTKNGSGVGAFFLKDNNGSTIVAGPQCWISKAPDIEYGEAPKPRVWTFRVVADPIAAIVGGN
jgi:hypothetical protein